MAGAQPFAPQTRERTKREERVEFDFISFSFSLSSLWRSPWPAVRPIINNSRIKEKERKKNTTQLIPFKAAKAWGQPWIGESWLKSLPRSCGLLGLDSINQSNSIHCLFFSFPFNYFHSKEEKTNNSSWVDWLIPFSCLLLHCFIPFDLFVGVCLSCAEHWAVPAPLTHTRQTNQIKWNFTNTAAPQEQQPNQSHSIKNKSFVFYWWIDGWTVPLGAMAAAKQIHLFFPLGREEKNEFCCCWWPAVQPSSSIIKQINFTLLNCFIV